MPDGSLLVTTSYTQSTAKKRLKAINIPMKMSLLLPPQNNFADLKERADALLKTTKDKSVMELAAIVGTLLYRCDLLEREVERLGREVPKPSSTKSSGPAKKR
jgi:hypothetical protein